MKSSGNVAMKDYFLLSSLFAKQLIEVQTIVSKRTVITMSPSKIWSIIWWRGSSVPSMSSWKTNSSRGSISPRRALRSHSSRRLCASGSTAMSNFPRFWISIEILKAKCKKIVKTKNAFCNVHQNAKNLSIFWDKNLCIFSFFFCTQCIYSRWKFECEKCQKLCENVKKCDWYEQAPFLVYHIEKICQVRIVQSMFCWKKSYSK